MSASGAVQLALLILVLPLVGHILLSRLRLSTYAKDRYLVLVSGAISTAGAFCLGLGPEVGIAIVGKELAKRVPLFSRWTKVSS